MEKSRPISSSFFLINLRERLTKTLKGKDFSWLGIPFPNLAVAITCHTKSKRSKISCVYLLAIFFSISKEELKSNGSGRSVPVDML